jgi:acetolactate synthase-1/2/3 large subunit
MKVSDYVIKFIEDLGVQHVFTLSGGGCIHLIDSLGKSTKIQYVCNLHEQGTGIATEAYSQYTNNIGVALVTTGPGGTNILTAIAGAYLDSTPMLVIAGQVQTIDSAKQYGVRQLGFQEVDVVSMAKPVTKYATTVMASKDIRYHLEKAVYLAKTGRPGPVLIEIPLDIQAKDIQNIESLTPYNIYNNEDAFTDIKPIVETLLRSKRPIILVGNGVRLDDAQSELNKFLKTTNIPVLTTWKAADMFSEDHPLFVGRPGAIASRGANFNQQNADFILCLGARLDHGQIAYQKKYFAPKAIKVVCDIDVSELSKLSGVIDYTVPHSVREFLIQLNQSSIIITQKDEWEKWLQHCKQTYLKYRLYNEKYDRNNNDVNLYNFIVELSDQLTNNTLIVPGSSGACSEVTYQALQIKNGQRLLNTPGLGAMGFGIAASIGACLASGKKHTICIEGDGGWMMNMQELEVIRRLNLPITFFVLNNNGYGSIKSTQDGYFDGNYVASTPESGVTLPSIKKIADVFDIEYRCISNNRSLQHNISTILAEKYRPIICEVICEQNHKTLPRSTVFKNEKDEFETAPMHLMRPALSEEEQAQEEII